MAVLALGARRAGELEGDVFRGSTAGRPEDRYEELSPPCGGGVAPELWATLCTVR